MEIYTKCLLALSIFCLYIISNTDCSTIRSNRCNTSSSLVNELISYNSIDTGICKSKITDKYPPTRPMDYQGQYPTSYNVLYRSKLTIKTEYVFKKTKNAIDVVLLLDASNIYDNYIKNSNYINLFKEVSSSLDIRVSVWCYGILGKSRAEYYEYLIDDLFTSDQNKFNEKIHRFMTENNKYRKSENLDSIKIAGDFINNRANPLLWRTNAYRCVCILPMYYYKKDNIDYLRDAQLNNNIGIAYIQVDPGDRVGGYPRIPGIPNSVYDYNSESEFTNLFTNWDFAQPIEYLFKYNALWAPEYIEFVNNKNLIETTGVSGSQDFVLDIDPEKIKDIKSVDLYLIGSPKLTIYIEPSLDPILTYSNVYKVDMYKLSKIDISHRNNNPNDGDVKYMFGKPSNGDLFIGDKNNKLDYNTYYDESVRIKLYYLANYYGNDEFEWWVSNDCHSVNAKIKLDVRFVNTPPVSNSFEVAFNQDSTNFKNNLIEFKTHISDLDITNGWKEQTLYYMITSMDTSKYKLVDNNGNSIQINKPYKVNENVYCILDGKTHGKFDISYRAYDEIAYSESTKLSLTISHVNTAPILNAPITQYQVKYDSKIVNMVLYIDDPDFPLEENYKVIVTDGSIPENQYINLDNIFLYSDAKYPITLDTRVTNSPYSITLNWNPVGDNQSGWIKLVAEDGYGLSSTPINISFKTTTRENPTISKFTPDKLNIDQGDKSEIITIIANHRDSVELSTSLKFRISVVTDVINNNVVNVEDENGVVYNLNKDHSATIVTGGTSTFRMRIAPDPSYYGEVKVYTTAIDFYNGKSTPATVIANVKRAHTIPIVDNTILNIKDTQEATIFIPAQVEYPQDSVFKIYIYYNEELHGELKYQGTVIENEVFFSDNYVEGNFIFQYLPTKYYYGNAQFNYKVCADPGKCSETFKCSITIDRVNYNPISKSQELKYKKNEQFKIVLEVSDPDLDDTVDTLIIYIVSFSNEENNLTFRGKLCYDEKLTDCIDTSSNNDVKLKSSTLYYKPLENLFGGPDRIFDKFTFIVQDQHEGKSEAYTVSIYIIPLDEPPKYIGNTVFEMKQNDGLSIQLFDNYMEFEQPDESAIITILKISDNKRGTLRQCGNNENGETVCMDIKLNEKLNYKNLLYNPRNNDWDDDFVTFDIQVMSDKTKKSTDYTLKINVMHVNSAPMIDTSISNILIDQSKNATIEWIVHDQDNLPTQLLSDLTFTLYTTFEWSIYQIEAVPGGIDSEKLVVNRDQYNANERLKEYTFQPYSISNSACQDEKVLKQAVIDGSIDYKQCQAAFKIKFVPYVNGSSIPWMTYSMKSYDPSHGITGVEVGNIAVRKVNLQPYIIAPSAISYTNKSNVVLQSNDIAVKLIDEDSFGGVEELSIRIVNGINTTINIPKDASCISNNGDKNDFTCRDIIDRFNLWLQRLTIDTSANRFTIQLTIDDLGHTGDSVDSPHLNSSINIDASFIETVSEASNSILLIVFIGATTVVGAGILGGLIYHFRNKVTPVKEDYFGIGEQAINTGIENPLFSRVN